MPFILHLTGKQKGIWVTHLPLVCLFDIQVMLINTQVMQTSRKILVICSNGLFSL